MSGRLPGIVTLWSSAFRSCSSSRRSCLRNWTHAAKDVILTSNTSSFPISAIAEGMKTVFRVVGLHYFNPAHIMPLVEIHRRGARQEMKRWRLHAV